MKRFFYLLSLICITGCVFSSCEKAKYEFESEQDDEVIPAYLEKWDIGNGDMYPDELWKYCIDDGNLSGFPKSEIYDYSDWAHTTSYLLIFNYRSFDYKSDIYVKKMQSESLHIFSKGDKKFGMSRLNSRAHSIKRISENLADVPEDYKHVYATSQGYYYSTEMMEMYDWKMFNRDAFKFETSYDYFWMYVHDKLEPDTCQMLLADTECIMIPANFNNFDLPQYIISSPFEGDLVMSGNDASWCYFYTQYAASKDYSCTPALVNRKFAIYAKTNNSYVERKGKLTFHVEGHPEHTITINVMQPSTHSGGGNGDDGNNEQEEKTFKVYPVVTVQRPNCDKESITTNGYINLYKSYETDGVIVKYKNGSYSTTIAGNSYTLRRGTNRITVHDDECLGHPYMSNGKILYYTYHDFIIKMTITITGDE